MNDLPRHKLSEIVATYGPDLLEDPHWTEALLNDLCGQYEREISALVTTEKSGIPADLLTRAKNMPGDIVVAQLTTQLAGALPLEWDAARWAVESWALALGVITRANDSSVRKAALHSLMRARRQ